MGKYADCEKDLFSIFGSSDWKAENIKTFPANFVARNADGGYIRVTIVPRSTGLNLLSVSGVIIIDIFTPVGDGPGRATFIADKLDHHLAGKTVKTASGGVTQLLGSTMQGVGVDEDNKALYRSDYTIPFNYFGVP
jgi:hypothetical protein